MRIVRVLIARAGPFERAEIPFGDDELGPRALTVVHGAGGVGKSTLVQALSTTRPGHAVAALPRLDPLAADAPPSPQLTAEWLLGTDEPGRPHTLRVASPNSRWSTDDAEEALRRREQAHYDKLAQDGGFAFLAIPGTRWFSRQPLVLSAPARSVARYDVRAPLALDDASRADLARDTKQALAYAAIAPALAGAPDAQERRLDLLGEAMRRAVERLVALSGFQYLGIDPFSFEPVFADARGRRASFDTLPTRVRHLAAFAALSVRVLWAAYPDQDPRDSEGVIAIDDVELHQDTAVLADLAQALRDSLPKAQWVLTTTSAALAASVPSSHVTALRRTGDDDAVSVFCGEQAVLH